MTKAKKPLRFTGGSLFQNECEEIAALQHHYRISLPPELIERVRPYAERLLSSTRKVGIADGRSVWWMTLLKLRIPNAFDWDNYNFGLQSGYAALGPIWHDLIPVYIETYTKLFASPDGGIRFFPFGGGFRRGDSDALEHGFVAFDTISNYSVWFLSLNDQRQYPIAKSFGVMMNFPQRRK